MQIGYATQHPDSPYWLIVDQGVREQAARQGLDLQMIPSYDLEQQIATINTLVGQRVDALMVGPIASAGLAGAVQRAQKAGIPVVVVASELRDCAPTCTVQANHATGAAMAARFMVERIGGSGKVAHLIGPLLMQDNVQRAAGVREVFGQYPGVELAFEQESPDWEAASAAAMMREALGRAPDLRGICVANDTLALGAIEAIEAAGRGGEIIVTGFDATPDALLAISQGRMHASIRQRMREIGRIAVDTAIKLAGGATVPPQVMIDVDLITNDNLNEPILDALAILPDVLRDALTRGQALARARDEVIAAQRTALRELSTPLITISETAILLPLIGAIDTARAGQVIETLLAGVAAQRIATVILDITGVPVVDTQVADALVMASQAVRLLGAEVVLTGIRPEVAQILVTLGADLNSLVTLGTVQSGIAYALRRTGGR